MIEAMPSITKNAMRIKVSERTPLGTGHNSNTKPTAIPRIAETSDHPKPGAWRIRKVVIKPTIPLMRKSQPQQDSDCERGIGGITTAARPRMMRMIPSTRKSTQCSCSDVATAR